MSLTNRIFLILALVFSDSIGLSYTFNIGMFLKDTAPPPTLSAFSAVTHASTVGAISYTVTFPANVSDYETVKIMRVSGSTAPAATCASGTTVQTFSSGGFSSGTYADTGLTAGSSYSYRACIWDKSDNLTASQTAVNVTARSCNGAVVGGYCWYLASSNGQGCNTVCSGRGGTTNGSIDYTGYPNGTVSNCHNVLVALNAGSGSTVDYYGASYAQGCVIVGSARRLYSDVATNQTTSGPISKRACSCVN